MSRITRDFFIQLSNNKFLNEKAKKYGFRLGAERFVAGTTIESVAKKIKEMNRRGISCTVDHLGEFVSDKSEARAAKNKIIQVVQRIFEEKLDAHISVKLTQLGFDIDDEFCYENIKEIVDVAAKYDIFINIDMESYKYYERTLHIVNRLLTHYDNVGTVIQTYLFRAEDDLEQLQDVRIRLVKGAYKESEKVSYQSKAEIDRNFLKLAKRRLLGEMFTSIATHDHRIINELKAFIKKKNIPYDRFEFQMLYGFRQEMQYDLAKKGYHFCTYMPFGHDWYGYYMRRLAERPQNVNLILKEVFYQKDNQLKKEPILAASASAVALTLFIVCKKKKNAKEKK
ncbi:proline dehydrogenase family protein [Bacillus sp. B15-48]|uniref:proline dehydrogenase family protein n=1 Tax=Bacillus sp. B15-48 TaxID=1548601 RepID=UPI00193F2EDB|nr:proline dehydrogenase family protein [Bacillus sp. B15-48]MBM4760947.1 proline dehydrogenase [Bacillus sp. B15-48]